MATKQWRVDAWGLVWILCVSSAVLWADGRQQERRPGRVASMDDLVPRSPLELERAMRMF